VSWSSYYSDSEGSCDSEDWSNDDEHHRNKSHLTVYSHLHWSISSLLIINAPVMIFQKESDISSVGCDVMSFHSVFTLLSGAQECYRDRTSDGGQSAHGQRSKVTPGYPRNCVCREEKCLWSCDSVATHSRENIGVCVCVRLPSVLWVALMITGFATLTSCVIRLRQKRHQPLSCVCVCVCVCRSGVTVMSRWGVTQVKMCVWVR